MKSSRITLAMLACLIVTLPARADVTHYRSGVQAEPGLLSFYPFDGDVAPTATDRVAPAQNGTLSGATFSSAAGTVGTQSLQGARAALGPVTAYEFAGGSGTVEMFLYQTATAAFNPCFFAGRDDAQSPTVRYSLHGGTAGNQLFIWNGSSAPSVTTPVSMLNNLVHVAYVFEAGLVTVYFNGAALVTWNEPLGAGVGRPFQIGSSGPGNQEAWPGRIDEVAIYGEALPAAAVAAHYAAFQTAGAGAPPLLTQQPQSLVLDAGQTATFSVQLADATGALYRWTRNGTNIPGATNASFLISPVTLADDNTTLRCVVYNPFGGTNSAPATLAIRARPTLLAQPSDAVRPIGQPFTLAVIASGTPPLAYQWTRNGQSIVDATNASLFFASLAVSNSGTYAVTVTNIFGSTPSSNAVLAVVPVAIVTPPADAVRFLGQSVTFTVSASGQAPLTYQWRHAGNPLPGATNPSVTLPALAPADAGAYSVLVSNGLGSTNSASAQLTLLQPQDPQQVLAPPPFEWLPQDNGSSADAAVVFSEIMYHAANGNTNLQWIELQNVLRVDVDLSNWRLDAGVNYTFPSNTIIPGGGFVVVAKNIAAFTNATGLTTAVFGPFTNNLSNGGEHLVLRNHDNRMMDEMTFGDEAPWPDGADGSGATLAKRTRFAPSGDALSWAASLQLGGTPGRANFTNSLAVPTLAFNEIDAATNAVVRVELHNTGAAPLGLAGFTLSVLTTNGATNFALPAGTLNPGAFAVFDSTQLGVQPPQNSRLFLLTSNATVLVDAATVKHRLRARSPDGRGRWAHPSVASFGASNVLALNRDIVINEIMYEGLPSYPSNRYAPSADEWVELFNRGTNTANLAGWRLDGGIRYAFPSNTMLAPGGYLVVAGDAAAFAAAHPGVPALGNFSGKLARRTDWIQLKDAADDVVNEVRYFSGGRWPALAGGGGSSLELLDPFADNRRAEAWAASDEAPRGAWQTITYRGVASANKGFDVGNNIWQELVIGLLEAGEFLLDDVSVIELPGTVQARQLIQNGSFEGDTPGGSPAFWRMPGNHGLHGRTVVETDPANPGNKVLHVVATGTTDFLHNHLETTLKSGGSIVTVVAGREYEISFRARWLNGARLLNTRLYANWLQRTTVLNAPGTNGTPGAINSRRLASTGPTYAGFSHTPAVPPAGANVTVSVHAYDPQGIAAMTLWWRVDGGAWNSVAMSGTADSPASGLYTATIPGQAGGTKIQFHVEGRDTLGAVSAFPAGGPEARALFIFDDGRASAALGSNLRFVMTTADTDKLYYPTNRLSNERLGATVIGDENEVFYDVGVRLKGSAFGRDNDTETGLSIEFDPDRRFRGAHGSISIERGNSRREILARFLFNQAGGGVAAGYDDVAQVVTPRPEESGRCIVSTTRTTDTLLDTQYGGGGTLYNFELLYTPTTTANGNPEGPKLNFPYNHNNGFPDIQDLGDDKEAYRWNFQLRNNRVEDDFSRMMAVGKSFELNGAALEAAARSAIDVDQWLRYFAMQSLVGNDDTYTRFYNHNMRLYQRPDDNRLVALPWDLDRAFNLATSATLWGNAPDMLGGTNRMRKVIESPGHLRIYYAQLLDLIARCYNTAYATRWANHFATLLNDGALAGYTTYIGNRASFVQGQIPAGAPFAITTSNGLAFTATSNLVTLAGTGPYAVRRLRVNGEFFDPTWISPSSWSIQLALSNGANGLTIEGLDARGNPVTNAPVSITITLNAVLDDPAGKVVINEIHYRPPLPGAEFIELFNNSTTTAFDLADWQLNGTGLIFPRSTILAPRAFLVVAADRLAVSAAYGAGVLVAEEFPGHVDGAGETISLLRPGPAPGTTTVVDRVRYEPNAPWPESADGLGLSLQLIDPAQDNARVSNWTDGNGWRYFVFTNRIGVSRLSMFFDSLGGEVYLDDLSLVAGLVPDAGPNLLVDGGFEQPLGTSWFATGVSTNSHRTNRLAHSGATSLRYLQVPGATTLTNFYQDIAPPVVTNGNYTLSGWFFVSGTNTNFTIRAGSAFQAKPSLVPANPTPGLANLGAASLPPYPPLWLNEIQPHNVQGPLDGAGQRDPWVEIHNAGAAPVSLDGFFLANNYTNLAQWAFPTGASVGPGQFVVVWLDGETNQGTASEWHANFRAAAGTGSLALARLVGGVPQLMDYLSYSGVASNESYGDVPDAQPFYRQTMFYPTPGATNDGRSAPIVVFINEWMAANNATSGIADPADGGYEDWFELYNPGPGDADLGGHFLTDNLANRFQFEIPNNGRYVIPAGGYLLVWADGEPLQNSTNQPDLHVSFSLRAAGEAIGLFAPDGTQIDAVTFTNQLDNVSLGRQPDGGATFVMLPNPSPRGSNGGASVSAPLLGDIQSLAGTVQFTLSTAAGRSYQVEFKDDLGAAPWLPLGGPRAATGPSLLVTDTPPAGQRFYRAVLLP